ncbi:hypothetical protein LTR36_005275 [Oleoguttula mirabilis]|uniref:Uncharacterized protein n=1 Tax=Oleoguttula mirabilis TaxID=1507867 RepID=A0AAV9JEL3_9PEZI|nr:hypothetical protein LTR36_005275 [Oleoguttula mirabilis]
MTSNISKVRAWLDGPESEHDPSLFFRERCPADIDYFEDPQCSAVTEHCPHCRTQYRTMQEQHIQQRFIYANETGDRDAQLLLDTCVEAIQDDVKFLQQHLPLYGDALLSRWKNKHKTRDKRAKLLRAALPAMQEHKHCVPELYYASKLHWYEGKQDYRIPWLLPYLSIDVLLEDPLMLMHMLHGRATHGVADWTLHDNKHLDAGWEAGAFRTQYNRGCVIMHGKSYGKLVHFDVQTCHQWLTIGFPRACLILEGQVVLYSFLRKAVELLLEGISGEGGSIKWHHTITNPEGGAQTSNVHKHAGHRMLQSPHLNLRALFEMMDTSRKAAEDELWLLVTDPAYVHHVLRAEQSTAIVRTIDPHHKWRHIIAATFWPVVTRAEIWRELAALCSSASEAYHRHQGATVTVQAALERTFWQSSGLSILEELCARLGENKAKDLKFRLMQSRAFEKHFTYTRTSDGTLHAVNKHQDNKMYTIDRTFWALMAMTEAFMSTRTRCWVLDGTFLVDFLEEHLNNSTAEENSRVDQHVSGLVSDLAVIDQVLCALRAHRPRTCGYGVTRNIDLASMPRSEEANWEYYHVGDNSGELERCLEAFAQSTWPKGVRDGKWLQQATQAREKLAAFWDRMRKVRRPVLLDSELTEEEIAEDLDRLRACKSQEHLAELEHERQAVAKLVAIQNSKATAAQTQLHSGVQHLSFTEETAPDVRDKKEKIKTRSLAFQTQDATPAADGVQPTVATRPPRIAVKANNLSMFKRMYPTEDAPAAKASVSWQHFLQAMVDAGFAIAQSRGSAVMFSRDEGSIVFHRPHPEPTIGPVMLQVMGKRLRKWFGWDREVFVERARDDLA